MTYAGVAAGGSVGGRGLDPMWGVTRYGGRGSRRHRSGTSQPERAKLAYEAVARVVHWDRDAPAR